MFYSASTNGFYDPTVNNDIPADSVEITTEYWQELIDAQSQGKKIEPDSKGYPVAVVIPITKDETLYAINYSIQVALDRGAEKWGYSNIVSAASYFGSNNAQYNADAIALMTWRDSVWEWAYPKYASVVPGETPEQFMVDMPPQPAKPIV